jgi:hypothetical protein
MPLPDGRPLPHEGRARYRTAKAHVFMIDLDDKYIVVEAHKDHLDELPNMDLRTFMLAEGDLCFLYYVKTPAIVRCLQNLSRVKHSG